MLLPGCLILSTAPEEFSLQRNAALSPPLRITSVTAVHSPSGPPFWLSAWVSHRHCLPWHVSPAVIYYHSTLLCCWEGALQPAILHTSTHASMFQPFCALNQSACASGAHVLPCLYWHAHPLRFECKWRCGYGGHTGSRCSLHRLTPHQRGCGRRSAACALDPCRSRCLPQKKSCCCHCCCCCCCGRFLSG